MDDMCYNYYEDHVLNWKEHSLYIQDPTSDIKLVF